MHLVITVHGIRTFGKWQARLGDLLTAAEPDVQVVNFKYGWFPALAFMIPPFRWILTRRFRSSLLAEARRRDWRRIDIVAHSFGTHLVAWGLHGVPAADRPRVHTLILAGSVLKTTFPWNDLLHGHVQRVVNECGTRDSVLVLNQALVLFTGMAGRVGFMAMTGQQFQNRFFPFGHSGYFLSEGRPSDTFMRERWIPLLTSDTPLPNADLEETPSGLAGFWTFCLKNAEPIKLAIYLAPFVGLTLLYLSLYRGERVAREAADRRLVQALVSRGDAEVRSGEWERGEASYAEARQRLLDRQAPTLPADLALWQLYRESPPPLYVTAPYTTGVITAVSLPHAGTTMLTSHSGGAVSVWDLRTGAWLRWLAVRGARVSHLAYDDEGTRARVERVDGTVETFEVTTAKVLERRTSAVKPGPAGVSSYPGPIPGEILSSDGTVAIVGMREPVLMDPREHAIESALRIVQKGPPDRLLRSFPGYADHVVTGAVADDKRFVVFATRDNTLELWPLGPARDFRYLESPAGSVLDLSPDGRWLLTSAADHSVVLRDLRVDRPIRVLRGHADAVSAGAFCGDTMRVIAVSRDGTLRAWDAATGRELAPARSLGSQPVGVSCAPGGRRAAVATADGRIATLDVESNAEPQRRAGTAGITSVAFSADAAIAVTADADGGVTLVDLTRGRTHALTSGARSRPIVGISVSADGRTAATADGGEAVVWDLARRQEIRRMQSPRGFQHVRLSQDGRWMGSGGLDSRLRVWDLQSGEEVRAFAEFAEGLKILHASRSLTTVVSSTAYGGRVVWEFARAPETLEFRRRLPGALEAIRRGDGGDASALALLGQWLAFRGQWAWAADALTTARDRGGAIDGTSLALCYWLADDRRGALREFQRAKEAGDRLAGLYLDAVAAESGPSKR